MQGHRLGSKRSPRQHAGRWREGAQVAEMPRAGRDKIYYLLRTGQLRSIKIGNSRRITSQDIAEFIAALEGRDHARR
jgi:excisionase family DNA binding protein